MHVLVTVMFARSKRFVKYFVDEDGRENLVELDATCSATTKRGRRCRNPVFHAQEWDWPHDGAQREAVTFFEWDAFARARSLLCQLHVESAVAAKFETQ